MSTNEICNSIPYLLPSLAQIDKRNRDNVILSLTIYREPDTVQCSQQMTQSETAPDVPNNSKYFRLAFSIIRSSIRLLKKDFYQHTVN
jgi:hypothetical protein